MSQALQVELDTLNAKLAEMEAANAASEARRQEDVAELFRRIDELTAGAVTQEQIDAVRAAAERVGSATVAEDAEDILPDFPTA